MVDAVARIPDKAQIITAIATVLIALFALHSERKMRSTESLMSLVKFFDDNGFFVRMWRLDQLTRGKNRATPIEAVLISGLLTSKNPEVAKLCKEAFGEDGGTDRADMYAVYFFALRLYAWLDTAKGFSFSKKIRLLNDTFGHQLLTTFLNHRIVACRIRASNKHENYYPSYYGLFDSHYKKLLNSLADDLLLPGYLQEFIRKSIKDNRNSLEKYLQKISSLQSTEVPINVMNDFQTPSETQVF